MDDALENYRSLPLEMSDLYKKYTLDIPLPEHYVVQENPKAESVARQVSERTRINFDAIVSGSYARSFDDSIRIVKAEDVSEAFLEGKLFKSRDDKLAAYSNAHSRYFIMIDSKGRKERSMNLLFLNNGSLPVQVIVNAESGSKLSIFEIFVSESESSGSVVALHEINAARGSEVEINALHNENASSNVLNLYKASIADDVKFRANFVYNGGLMTKSRGVVDSSGIESRVEINEIAFGAGEQKFDLGNLISNTKPMSHAQLNSGAVLDGRSQCMLKGFAKVEKGTKGCFSRITERGILLSGDAHIDALPDMSIDYGNGVKATHSAATSPIDREALFYLESRGLEEEQARKMFITAFISKYMSNISNGAASEIAMSVMLEKLERGTFGVISDLTAKGVWISKQVEE
jgi:Fe-S cluster assembly scaffold protein SufB